MLGAEIHFNVSISDIIHSMRIGCLFICRLACCLDTGLDLLRQLRNLCLLIHGPAVSRTVYIDSASACSIKLSLCTHSIILCGNLRNIICYMLMESGVVPQKLSFVVKLKPLSDLRRYK